MHHRHQLIGSLREFVTDHCRIQLFTPWELYLFSLTPTPLTTRAARWPNVPQMMTRARSPGSMTLVIADSTPLRPEPGRGTT